MKRLLSVLLCVILLLGTVAALPQALAVGTEQAQVTRLADLNRHGRRIGIRTGTVYDKMADELFPLAEKQYFDSFSDMAYLVSTGDLDAYLNDEPLARYAEREFPGLRILDEHLNEDAYALAFPKTEAGKALCDQYSEFIRKCRTDGTLQKMDDIWFGTDESAKVVDRSGITGENGTIRCICEPIIVPFCYMKDGEVTGFLADLSARFCTEYGYFDEWTTANFDAELPALASGKCDVAMDCISITEERSQQVYFSEPFYVGGGVVVVKDQSNTDVIEPEDAAKLDKLLKKKIVFGSTDGSCYEQIIYDNFGKDADVRYFKSIADKFTAVREEKIDAFVQSKLSVRAYMRSDGGVTYIDKTLAKLPSVFVFQKNADGEKLKAQMDEFVQKLRSDGTMDQILNYWDSSSVKAPDFSDLEKNKPVLHVATDGMQPPFSFVINNQLAGIDIDLIVRFCREYGYGLELSICPFGSILSGIATGNYNIGASNIALTEERKQNATLSEPYLENDIVLVIKGREKATVGGFFENLAESIRKTFIVEERWKMIVHGILTTLLISLLSALLGTLLGFGICTLRRSKSSFLRGFAIVYIRLMQGVPMVLLLMFLFYVIFAKSGLPAVFVAIFAFSLNFAAYSSEVMRGGIDAVDHGQYEAALTVGYSETKAFFHIVMPQAIRNFLPVYRGELVSLVKGTSVVGYIAVEDLTKVSDIIRSRTYEAFFPLVASAAIYFLLAWLLTLLLKLVEIRATPNRKRRTVKGVTMQ